MVSRLILKSWLVGWLVIRCLIDRLIGWVSWLAGWGPMLCAWSIGQTVGCSVDV